MYAALAVDTLAFGSRRKDDKESILNSNDAKWWLNL